MSQAKLTLRPPPNVDFVQGYPGIPPGAPDRPQAAVKGAIEVRMGPSGVKAKYVRVELRKIETLPGGQQNTFYDFVGQSPINLWQSSEEYGVLHTQDIPFYIRIPESIPPSLALEKGAGVKYELVGQVCIQGKTGFFRRNKSIVLSSSTPIIIDKHELHSTWPIYQQPESRNLSQDAVLLTVERTQNCYGPGDRVSVWATIRSDSLHTVILRGFEFTLKETTIFRAGPHATGKKGAPQVKINIVGDQKVPVNNTLYGGTKHKVELSCTIPQTHTTTTLTSARHIDITYVLIVKALMGTGKPLIMELPVIVSNWPRYVSAEAVRRIGIAPSLGQQHPGVAVTTAAPTSPRPNTAPSSGPAFPSTISARTDPVDYHGAYGVGRQSSTLPNLNGHTPNAPSLGISDEFGALSNGNGSASYSDQRRPSTAGNEPSGRSEPDVGSAGGSGVGVGRRPRSSLVGQPNRFTIVNQADDEIPEDEDHAPASTSQRPAPEPPRNATAWPTAEEEKARLYQQAKAEVERVQGGLDRMSSLRSTATAASPRGSGHPPPLPASETTRWPTAEEEKVRLFNQAQNNARIMQGLVTPEATSPASQVSHGRGDSRDSGRSYPPGRAQASISAGAALYSAAMSSVKKPANGGSPPASWPQNGTPPPSMHSPQPRTPPRLPTAAEEKEMLRRYQEAANAVQRHHETYFGPPDGGSSSYGAPDGAHMPVPEHVPTPDDLPPPWVPSADFPQVQPMSEKERYRLAYEAREAAAARATTPPMPDSPPVDYYSATSSPAAGPPPAWHPTPPPGHASLPSHIRARSPPATPTNGPARPLTAAEEKAMLKAKYAAESQPQAQPEPPSSPPPFGSYSTASQHSQPPVTPPPPPPLMPRPPVEYIQETREEDARLRDLDDGALEPPHGMLDLGGDDTFGLKLRPTSPFTLGWDSATVRTSNGVNGPPPLPPKVPVDE
ncbi:hypothetical protein BV25DRAFT_1909846 [Artomyces pyxidatus]|uniref:Uncharacterized protein n=1 Tax=Artomyces pyxidatus TaxID=48021 RepID=A0ACB8SJR7_9AGAM|nr:hypothetical protein BV25DRAFT_1909846 [Artomyces pyxidatus]